MNTNFYACVNNYHKTLDRLQRNLQSGRFASYSQNKKLQIWNRLCRYARQLGIKIKAPIAAACMAAGLCFSTPATGQLNFTEQTGAANPLNGVSVLSSSAPAFVDIDNDGDNDIFIGEQYGAVTYYKNTGTASSPAFTLQTGAANPFDGVDLGYYFKPAFVDIDNDGDKDAFVGDIYGNIFYFKNTGTAAIPVFTQQLNAANPFNAVVVGGHAAPAFVDIDGDGDKDAFIGANDRTLSYYKNTGTVAAPIFTLQSGATDPFNGVSFPYRVAPAFADLDADGDMDIFFGDYDGNINYYKNTGTASVPVFTVQTGAANPFNGLNFTGRAMPALVDIDGDGDSDVFVGADGGTVRYFKNTSILLPLKLISFSGSGHAGYNHLQWQTADEVNTKLFEIERSSDANRFTKIASLNTTGTSDNKYSLDDQVVYSGKLFYRLKMVDMDDRFTYSPVILINSYNAAALSIYPNPATDVLYINTGNANILNTTARIYDASGRLMQNILINNNPQQLHVKALTAGMYTIKFADGSLQRFVKQ